MGRLAGEISSTARNLEAWSENLFLVDRGTVAGVQCSSKDPVLGVFPYRGLINTEGVPLPARSTLVECITRISVCNHLSSAPM